jgi:hypothetical protein
MAKMLSPFASNPSVLVRNVHYNPLGERISKCPSEDWRNPMLIDLYNKALRTKCRALNITFVDTNFIMGPVWDTATDWCHYDGKHGRAEALHLAKLVTSMPGLVPASSVTDEAVKSGCVCNCTRRDPADPDVVVLAFEQGQGGTPSGCQKRCAEHFTCGYKGGVYAQKMC